MFTNYLSVKLLVCQAPCQKKSSSLFVNRETAMLSSPHTNVFNILNVVDFQHENTFTKCYHTMLSSPHKINVELFRYIKPLQPRKRFLHFCPCYQYITSFLAMLECQWGSNVFWGILDPQKSHLERSENKS